MFHTCSQESSSMYTVSQLTAMTAVAMMAEAISPGCLGGCSGSTHDRRLAFCTSSAALSVTHSSYSHIHRTHRPHIGPDDLSEHSRHVALAGLRVEIFCDVDARRLVPLCRRYYLRSQILHAISFWLRPRNPRAGEGFISSAPLQVGASRLFAVAGALAHDRQTKPF